MRAFKVSLNGKKLCLAGVGHEGVLTAIVNSVTGIRPSAADGREDLFLEVGGLFSPTDEHFKWVHQKHLHVGDRIQVQIVDTTSADRPIKKYRLDAADRLTSQKRYVRMMAKQLGWKIQTQR